MLNTTGPLAGLYKGSSTDCGSWPTDTAMLALVRELESQGFSRWQIAQAAGVSAGTVQHYLTSAI